MIVESIKSQLILLQVIITHNNSRAVVHNPWVPLSFFFFPDPNQWYPQTR